MQKAFRWKPSAATSTPYASGAADASLKTVGGDMRGEQLTAESLNVRSVSGDTALDALSVKSLKCTSVSGRQTYNMACAFEKVDVTAVSGNVIITAPVEAMGCEPALHQRSRAHRRRQHP